MRLTAVRLKSIFLKASFDRNLQIPSMALFRRSCNISPWCMMCMSMVSSSINCGLRYTWPALETKQPASCIHTSGSCKQVDVSPRHVQRNPLSLRLDEKAIYVVFNNLSNGDENMDCNTFASGLQRLSLGVHPFEIRDIFLDMDQNNDGRITLKVLSY